MFRSFECLFTNGRTGSLRLGLDDWLDGVGVFGVLVVWPEAMLVGRLCPELLCSPCLAHAKAHACTAGYAGVFALGEVSAVWAVVRARRALRTVAVSV